MEKYKPHILCLNETRTDPAKLKTQRIKLPDTHPYQYWNCCKIKKGYSGTAVISLIEPVQILEDFEGHD